MVVVLGDFNCVMDNNLDILSGSKHNFNTVQAFNKLVNEIDLVDIWRHNNKNKKIYTWSGKKPLVARRLDYIFVSQFFLPFINDCSIASIGHSDHRIVISNVEFNSFERGKGTFKMNSSLFDNHKFISSIKNLIKKNIEDLKDLNPILKWEAIKVMIREQTQFYGKFNKFKNKEEVRELKCELLTLENQLSIDITDLDKQNKVEIVKKKLEIKTLEEATAAKIRSKVKWIEEGEKCSRYFLALEKHRGVNNTVFKINDENGNIKKQGPDIVKVFAKHFSRVYKNALDNNYINNKLDNFLSHVELKKLSNFEKDEMENNITINEMLIAINSLNQKASPGIDGFSLDFYKIFFDDIKDLLFEFYIECFKQKKLSENCQLGIISLIHKGKGLSRDELSNWRPITLSIVDYKIIAKLLANRLKKVISNLVGKQQQGFVKGRNICNIIRGIDDAIEFQRNNNLNNLLFIIDFKQAFDRINTEYICQVFKKFGFGEYYITWLKTLFSNRKSCVKNGGHISELFEVQTGVKQGCPLAPLLFILAAEILAQNVIQDEKIKGVKYPYPDNDRHLKIFQFADDTSFLCQSAIDIKEILSRLKIFSTFSGLEINIKKCAILPMIKNNFNVETIENIILTDQVKIVGIYFRNDKSASEIKENWEGRISKIRDIVKNWMKRKLTVIGKIQVIKTFLISQFVFLLQSIVLPSKVLDEINTIFFRFIWKQDNIDNKAWERLSRKVLCNKTKYGGLEMINMHDFQNSFLLKWGCQLIDDSEDDWKLLPNEIFKKLGGLSVFKSKLEFKKMKGIHEINSKFWKRVLQLWIENKTIDDTIFSCDTINNNKHLSIKNEPILVKNTNTCNIKYIKDIINEQGEIIPYLEYKNKKGIHTSNLVDYVTIVSAIKKIKSKIVFTEDDKNLFYNGKNTKNMKRKHFYDFLIQENRCHCEKLWERKMEKALNEDTWKNIFLCTKETKLQDFQWKIVHNIFPTNILLTRIGIKNSEKCELCGVTDYIEHLFIECRRIGSFWKKVETLLFSKTDKLIKLNSNIILLGIEQDKQHEKLSKSTIHAINEILIIGKLSISKSKINDLNIELVFERELSLRNKI